MFKKLAAVSMAIALATSIAPPLMDTAHSQSISIGNNEQKLGQILVQRGYTDLVVTRRGFTITNFEGCRNGEKFRLKVNVLGQIKSTFKIGTCGSRFSAKAATDAMRNAGYTDIDARGSGDQVVAIGCRENRKYRLTFNLRGDVIDRARQGRCRADALRPKQVRASLRERGYDRIRFTDRELPRYVAEACADRSRVELVINRRGEINRERKIGQCPGPLDPKNLASVLRDQGYERVRPVQTRRAPYMARACKGRERQEIIVSRYGEAMSSTKIGNCQDAIRPANLSAAVAKLGYSKVKVLRGNRTPYLVEACKGRDLMELTLSRYGDVESEDRVGSCGAPLSAAAARVKLSAAEYYVVEMKQRNNRSWDVEACKNNRTVTLRINRFGEIARERDRGACETPSIFSVVRDLEARGASTTDFFVEGCFKNRNYRWTFNRLGKRINRKTLKGSC